MDRSDNSYFSLSFQPYAMWPRFNLNPVDELELGWYWGECGAQILHWGEGFDANDTDLFSD